MKPLPRALFISHGGGPLPLLDDPSHREMVSCLQGIAAAIPRPDAILVVSAHWEERIPTLTAGSRPPLIYDYYGFPPQSYDIQYPAAGQPALAREVRDMLCGQGIEAKLDDARGFDHGVFVPMKIMYPQADIPCVQLSLVDTLDPRPHIAVGRALQNLADRNVLVIGSGSSFHNLQAFFSPHNDELFRLNHAFESWLQGVCRRRDVAEHERREMLEHWGSAPGARFSHPREEHLLPLHVCYGAAQAPCTDVFEVTIMQIKSSMYLW